MNKPKISSRFDVDDIRKIRDYNSSRHMNMTPAEIVADTKAGAATLKKRDKISLCILIM